MSVLRFYEIRRFLKSEKKITSSEYIKTFLRQNGKCWKLWPNLLNIHAERAVGESGPSHAQLCCLVISEPCHNTTRRWCVNERFLITQLSARPLLAMASAFAAKMGLNSLMRKQPRNFSVRICTMESDMEFSCEVCYYMCLRNWAWCLIKGLAHKTKYKLSHWPVLGIVMHCNATA